MGILDTLFGSEINSPINYDEIGNSVQQPVLPEKERYNYSPHRLINGGLRDILGAIADAHSESQGMTPLYKAKRDKEEIGSLMEGFKTDPMGTIQKMARVDPAYAQKYYNDFLESQRNETAQRRYENTAANDELLRTRKARELIGGLLRSARGADAQTAARSQADIIAQRAGISLDDLPALEDADGLANWVNGTMSVKDQRGLEYKDRRGDQFDAAQDERVRHNQTTEGQADQRINIDRNYKKAQVFLGGGRLKQNANNAAVAAKQRAAALNQGQQRIDEQHQNNTARNNQAIIARITKENPGTTNVRVSRITGQRQFSTDNGKTWKNAP